MPNPVEGLVYYVVFLFSTTLHEAAHAWAAQRGGDPTAYHGGQVSLDPRPHIRREPIGMVVIPLVTALLSGWPLGFASAPYDPTWALRHPKRLGWMSLSGPGANLLLVIAAGMLIRLGGLFDIFFPPESISFGSIAGAYDTGIASSLAYFLGAVFSMNLLLGIFNLIPVPPLDGSGVALLLMSPETGRRYQEFVFELRAAAGIGLIAAWYLMDSLFQPFFLLAVNLLYPGYNYR